MPYKPAIIFENYFNPFYSHACRAHMHRVHQSQPELSGQGHIIRSHTRPLTFSSRKTTKNQITVILKQQRPIPIL